MKQPPYRAPDFSLSDSNGKAVSLTDFKGKWLVLYFYPKDDTPGCTIEACSLRDAQDDLSSLDAEVVGISRDDPSSHKKFTAKHSLNFRLLSDPDTVVIDSYGVWGKKMSGREGILRRTFLIDPTGMVRKVYGRVTPVGHGAQIASDLEALQRSIR